MHARWRFRVVREDTGIYVVQDGVLLEHLGTDTEALAIAVRLQDEAPAAEHVAAVSLGPPADLTNTAGRHIGEVVERPDRQGWNVVVDGLSIWYGTLPHAVSYAAWRLRGYAGELRIVNRAGAVTHVVLIDTSRGNDGRLYAPGGAMGSPGNSSNRRSNPS